MLKIGTKDDLNIKQFPKKIHNLESNTFFQRAKTFASNYEIVTFAIWTKCHQMAKSDGATQDHMLVLLRNIDIAWLFVKKSDLKKYGILII